MIETIHFIVFASAVFFIMLVLIVWALFAMLGELGDIRCRSEDIKAEFNLLNYTLRKNKE